ncbi:aminotransferase [Slackia heliotrinireducens]|uniref:Aminotransferase n=1 Tax=Slackia heliotrinireducens (strain ATCC 29202 / DSM 20476 / NCTC 11029 / RHS 1) TaxID=471855 RepID=C7N122_SLAHD|nr:aminotransferase [Slackia heliotrinireducens]ACV23244.1 aminotransferase [Slackia heliotrinireducens DSM 20476]VEH02381.1 Aspartate aminotransferase [Slackia heliotrinireducens]
MKIRTIGVEEFLNIWEHDATWDIGQSTISSLTMGEILALDGQDGATFYERLDREKMNYGWIEGSAEFKAEVAKLYKNVDPDNVLQMNGGTGANLNAIMALVEPGDHVVAEYPTYQPLYDLPRALGAEVDYWHIHEEDGWQPRIDELKELVRPDTKLICINNASNPLGAVITTEMMEEIVEIARHVDAWVLCDEVFFPLEDPEKCSSIVDLYEKGVATNSVSKDYSVPAARCGWTVSNKELADRMRVLRDYTMICSGVFNDALATYVLRNRDKIIERNLGIIRRNREIVNEWMATEPRASWIPPKGVSVSYMRLDIPENDEVFCLRLLKEEGVLLVPGSRFELPCGARLGYCASEDVLREGLKRLSKSLRQFD